MGIVRASDDSCNNAPRRPGGMIDAFGVVSFNADPTAGGRVWSREHGHYH